jgi:arylsulfatase A-like enzyme
MATAGRLRAAGWLRAAAASLLALAQVSVPAAGAERTNVVIILADDLGYGDLGCYGHPKFKTPSIDRLASEGVRLTNFYTPCPYCAPTRVALQTGRYQFRSGVTGNPFPREDLGGVRGGHEIGIPASEITLGEAFQAAGVQSVSGGMPTFERVHNLVVRMS